MIFYYCLLDYIIYYIVLLYIIYLISFVFFFPFGLESRRVRSQRRIGLASSSKPMSMSLPTGFGSY